MKPTGNISYPSRQQLFSVGIFPLAPDYIGLEWKLRAIRPTDKEE